jgi:ribokinase
MYDIIAIGSATADVFVKTRASDTEIVAHGRQHRDVCYPVGAKILVEDLTFDTGGGGTNSAVAFARLGLRTGWLGKLGTDDNSRRVLEQLHAEGVDFLGTAAPGRTGYSVIIVGLEKDRTILAYKGINDQLRFSEVNLPRLKAKWLYCSAMLGESFKTLERLAAYARKHGIKYAFNPSRYLAEQGMEKLHGIIGGCDALILNRDEASLLSGLRPEDIDGLLRALHEHARIVVITDGKAGAFATDGETRWFIQPHKIDVVETTGAGDAFASGFVAGLAKGRSIPDALKLGLVNAESVIRHIGAKNNLLTMAEARQAMRRRTVVRARPL